MALAAAGVFALANRVFANVALTQVSSDPFTNSTAVNGVAVDHATVEEPDTFAYGSTIVSAFQVGRFHDGGADDIGVAVSTNGGQSWKHSLLPGLTFQVDPTSPYERVSDAAVAYDARNNVWMVCSIPITTTGVQARRLRPGDGRASLQPCPTPGRSPAQWVRHRPRSRPHPARPRLPA